jgi:hypothetical protein
LFQNNFNNLAFILAEKKSMTRHLISPSNSTTVSSESSVTGHEPHIISPPMPDVEVVAPRRRNGRPQACEPCRKRKMACDHSLPVCTRCKRRKIAKDCIYLAAPMTRGSESVRTRIGSESDGISGMSGVTYQTQDSSAQQIQDETEWNFNSPLTPSTLTMRASVRSDHGPRRYPKTELFNGPRAYLGPTSFSAIFNENRDSLESLPTSRQAKSTPSDGRVEQSTVDSSEEFIPENLMRLGLSVLAQVPSREVCSALFNVFISPNDGWPKLAGKEFADGLWDVWDNSKGPRLNHLRDHDFVKLLFQNTASILYDEDDPIKWRASFTGKNMRWETLGILFAYWAYGAVESNNSDFQISSQAPPLNDRWMLMIELKECVSKCILMCNAVDSCNYLFMYLLHKHNLLESLIVGDASKYITN